MRKTYVTLLAVILGFISVSSGYADKSRHSHKRNDPPQQPRLTKDGAIDPNSIPDLVAYELFLNSLTSTPEEGERGRDRVRVFADKVGLSNPVEVDALLFNASDFKRNIRVLEKQVMEIKDRTWPNPSQETWAQLRGLQVQKEALVDRAISTLISRIGTQGANKIAVRVGQIKRQVKGYADVPVIPGQRSKTAYHVPSIPSYSWNTFREVSGWAGLGVGRFTKPISVAEPAQMGDGTVYVYSDTGASLDSLLVYGYGSISTSSDSYGHVYNLRIVETYGPVPGMYSSGSNSTPNVQLF